MDKKVICIKYFECIFYIAYHEYIIYINVHFKSVRETKITYTVKREMLKERNNQSDYFLLKNLSNFIRWQDEKYMKVQIKYVFLIVRINSSYIYSL